MIDKIEEKLATLKVPEYAMKVIREEQAKLAFLDPHSSEFSITRYFDIVTYHLFVVISLFKKLLGLADQHPMGQNDG